MLRFWGSIASIGRQMYGVLWHSNLRHPPRLRWWPVCGRHRCSRAGRCCDVRRGRRVGRSWWRRADGRLEKGNAHVWDCCWDCASDWWPEAFDLSLPLACVSVREEDQHIANMRPWIKSWIFVMKPIWASPLIYSWLN